MKIRKLNNPTTEKFIKETISLIEEKGGSKNVNLREISKRVGCAHTNAYNYFDGFAGLMWAAFEEALVIYGKAIKYGLKNEMSGKDYFIRLITNLVNFATDNPGLYRFISSDPIAQESIPEHLIVMVTKMKNYFTDVILQLSKERLSAEEAQNVSDIILSYIDGETFNLINGRLLPSDDIKTRVFANAELLFTRLTSKNCDGIILNKESANPGNINFPVLEI